jgi:hypothetical protein
MPKLRVLSASEVCKIQRICKWRIEKSTHVAIDMGKNLEKLPALNEVNSL